MTSALVAPLHGLGLSPVEVYPAALVLLHALMTSTVVAAWLLLQRLFDATSRLLPVLGVPLP